MLNIILIIAALMTGLSCSTDPEPINFGQDQCSLCMMNISETKFGAEVVTKKGKIYKYDGTECMLNALSLGKIQTGDVSGYFVIDAANPKQLTSALNAVYLISEKFPSPMGAGLSAFSKISDAESYQKQFGGILKSWDDLLVKFKVK